VSINQNIFTFILTLIEISQMFGQKTMPEKGMFYYSDDCHTTEIEFFEGSTLCIINTVCDVAMYSVACGTYQWNGDTLLFTYDPIKFLNTHLKIDTIGCKKGEVLIQLKTIAPLDEPEWSNILTLATAFPDKTRDSLRLLDAMSWPGMQNKFQWSEISGLDTLKLDRLGIIAGPSIQIPDANCMNVEYPVLWRSSIHNPRQYNKFVFNRISKKYARITFTNGNYKWAAKFKYVIRDPF